MEVAALTQYDETILFLIGNLAISTLEVGSRGAGEMVQRLRVLVALPEDLDWFLEPMAHNHL